MRAARFAWAARIAGCAALAAWIVAPLWLRPGMPLFVHDWVWSPYAARTLWTWQLSLSAWSPAGLGEPNSAVTLNPAAWLKLVPALLLDGRSSQLLYLFASLVAALLGVLRLARRNLALAEPYAWSAVALFAATPFLFSKIASGQSSYWAAIGAFAWGLSLADDALQTRSYRIAALAGACFAVATLQLQFLPFAWIALAVLWCARPSARGFGCALFGALCASSLALPEISFLAVRGPEAGASVSPAYPFWRFVQSSSPVDAAAMLGYSVRYTENAAGLALPFVVAGAWCAIAFAAAGVALRRSRAAFAFAALGAIGWAWTCGINGPLAALWNAAFASAPETAFLREFYHGAVLYAIPLALLAALGAEEAATRLRGPAGRAMLPAVCGVAALLGWATWTLGFARVLPAVELPDDRAAIARAAGPPAGGRVLFLPAQQPITLAGALVGGDDGGDWVDAERTSVYEFYLEPALAGAVDASAAGDARAIAMLRREGVDAAIVRPWLVSPAVPAVDAGRSASVFASAGPPAAGAGPGEAISRIGGDARASRATSVQPLPADLRAMGGDAATVYADVPGFDASGALAGRLPYRPDPALGWVGRRDAPPFAPLVPGAPSYGIETTRVGERIEIDGGRAGRALVWAPAGIDLGGRRYTAASPAWIALPQRFSAIAHGPAAIYETGELAADDTGAYPAVKFEDVARVAPWKYEGVLAIDGRAAIVLRERYDPAWTLDAPDVRVVAHERADGYANLFIVEGHATERVALEYRTQTPVFVLLGLSLAAFIATLAFGASRREAL